MKKLTLARARAARMLLVSLIVMASCALAGVRVARAEAWGGVEPFKSRRADVERAIGKPVEDRPGETGTLRFKVQGGMITIAFVDEHFVGAHHLDPDLIGTVRQVVLQHDAATETPDTLKLNGNSAFEHDAQGNAEVFRNQHDGIAYTFIEGKLRTTYYSPSAEQFKRAQR
ncbi:MAG: hypothetical protein QOE33_3086 [Acidobacteriota bacterium]|nr:hypothetical protein [Acidobacteriota bacterium]